MSHTRIPGRRLLHSPGPTPLPDEVLHAMSVQPMDLGDARVDANVKSVFAVHADTATGVTNDLAAIRRAIDAAGHPALLVADVVSTLAAAPFAMDDLRVDVAVGASQKG